MSLAAIPRGPALPAARPLPSPLRVQGAAPGRSWGALAADLFIFALVFFMVAFPKGGIKIYDIPITFGYLLTPVLLLLAILRARQLAIPFDRLFIVCACLAMSGWAALTVRFNGTDSFGFTVAFFVSTLYMPLFGMIAFSGLLLDRYGTAVDRALLFAVRAVVIYGLFLFAYKTLTGSFIEIPYLTANVGDIGTLEDKYINRGGIFKLISTYNNGNIFGVTMCTLGPLYLRLEKRRVLKLAFYAALLMTLSRTVWLGLIALLVMEAASRRVRPSTVVYLAAGMIVAATAIYYVLGWLGQDLSFVFDSNLGGRARQLNAFGDSGLIPHRPVEALPEVIYAGVVRSYGWLGLVLFVGYLLTPAMLLKLEGVRLLSLARSSGCMQGMLLYAVLAASDGAFSLIPVMMVFWIVAGVGFWYRRREEAELRRWRAQRRQAAAPVRQPRARCAVSDLPERSPA